MSKTWAIHLHGDDCTFMADSQELAFHICATLTGGANGGTGVPDGEAITPLADTTNSKFERIYGRSIEKSQQHFSANGHAEMIKALRTLVMGPRKLRQSMNDTIKGMSDESAAQYVTEWEVIHRNKTLPLKIIANDMIAVFEGRVSYASEK